MKHIIEIKFGSRHVVLSTKLYDILRETPSAYVIYHQEGLVGEILMINKSKVQSATTPVDPNRSIAYVIVENKNPQSSKDYAELSERFEKVSAEYAQLRVKYQELLKNIDNLIDKYRPKGGDNK